jgi:hypothetical protein
VNEQPLPRARWALYAAGTGLVAYGAYGLLTANRSAPLAWARFAALLVVANDGVLAPLVVATGATIVRIMPGGSRAYVQSGLFISGTLILLALPFVLGFGRTSDLQSALPLDYGTGLLLTLAAVWLGIGAAAGGRHIARRRRHGNATSSANDGPLP